MIYIIFSFYRESIGPINIIFKNKILSSELESTRIDLRKVLRFLKTEDFSNLSIFECEN